MIINAQELGNQFMDLLNNGLIHILVIVVIVDIATGLAKGFIVKDSNSTKGLQGLIKHLLVLFLVIVSTPYLNLMGYEWASNLFIFFYIAVYGISVTENLGQMGIPFPKWVTKRLTKLQQDSNDIDEK